MRIVPPIPCTLDGVLVPVVRVVDTVGRTWIQHQYPGRSKPDLEDAGGLPDRFQVEAVVTGPTWRLVAGALRAIARTGPAIGTHIFIHPFWGTFYGAVLDMQIEHTDDDEDTCRVSFTFVEGNLLPIAFSVAGSAAAAQAAVEAAAVAAVAAAAALPV